MQIFAGTSGFSYAEWCGRFYPEALPPAQMLRFYSGRLPTVEINNSFYRLPTREQMVTWREQVPESFCFAVKATRRITHQKKISNVAADVAELFAVVDVLEQQLGPVLFQLPPFLKKDLGLLESFLSVLPQGRRAALEFRHPSWFGDDVYQLLAAHNVALVGGDLEELEKSPPLVATADFGYLRLRRLDYDPATLAEWAARIQAQGFQRVYAYLKHEVLGPLFAEALLASLNGQPMADLSSIRAALAAPATPKSRRSPKPRSVQPASRGSERAPKNSKPQAKSERASNDASPRASNVASERASNVASTRASNVASTRVSRAPKSVAKPSAAPNAKPPSKSRKS